jgi:hypothetical protein
VRRNRFYMKEIILHIGKGLQTLKVVSEGPVEIGGEIDFRFEFDSSIYLDSYFKPRERYLSAMVNYVITMELAEATDPGSFLLTSVAKRVILGSLRCFDAKKQKETTSLHVIRIDGSDYFSIKVTGEMLAEVLNVAGAADLRDLIVHRPLVSELPNSFAIDYFYPGLFSRRFIVDQSVDWFQKDVRSLALSSWEIGLG